MDVARIALIGMLAVTPAVAAQSAAVQEEADGAKEAAAPAFDAVMDQIFTSVDGSSITLNGNEGGFAREIIAPNGSLQKIYFRFLGPKLGTVADMADSAAVIGVFRLSGPQIDVQYSDDSTETLTANGAGGLSLQAKSTKDGLSCTSWYPDGHHFSVEERKAALARYAAKLGLTEGVEKTAPVMVSDCKSASQARNDVPSAKVEEKEVSLKDAKPVHATKLAVTAPAKLTTALGAAVSAAPAAPAQPIEVRPSVVQPIDGNPAAEPQEPQRVASLAAPDSAIPNKKSASACLSVESDGGHWGFRNGCDFAVQFAYCVMDENPLASCHDGAVTGSVASKGFGPLFADETLSESDASHHFRWVACEGGAGEVIPRLDKIDPPSGRCVR